MSSSSDIAITLQRQRRENIRWYLIVTLHLSVPIGASVPVLLSVVHANYPDATELEIKRELDYLEARQLVTIERDPTDRWHSELTRHGVDVAEYTVPVEPGIARPKFAAG